MHALFLISHTPLFIGRASQPRRYSCEAVASPSAQNESKQNRQPAQGTTSSLGIYLVSCCVLCVWSVCVMCVCLVCFSMPPLPMLFFSCVVLSLLALCVLLQTASPSPRKHASPSKPAAARAQADDFEVDSPPPKPLPLVRRPALKRLLIEQLTPILTIHLKR